MRKVSETKYMLIEYDETKQLLKNIWLGDNSDLTENEIKAEISVLADSIIKQRPIIILSDDSNRQFAYSVDIQNWVATSLTNACLQTNIQKYAIVMPHDILGELSTEQTVDEAKNTPFTIKFFDRENNALIWLLG